jgi:hypothetical protein
MPPPKVRENLKRAAFLPVLTTAATFGLASGHTITPASQCRLGRLWRDKANFHEARRSEHAACSKARGAARSAAGDDGQSSPSAPVLLCRLHSHRGLDTIADRHCAKPKLNRRLAVGRHCSWFSIETEIPKLEVAGSRRSDPLCEQLGV